MQLENAKPLIANMLESKLEIKGENVDLDMRQENKLQNEMGSLNVMVFSPKIATARYSNWESEGKLVLAYIVLHFTLNPYEPKASLALLISSLCIFVCIYLGKLQYVMHM